MRCHKIHIDPGKVKDAIAKIYEITKKNDDHDFRLDYDKKPIQYEYIDANKMTTYDRKAMGRARINRDMDSNESLSEL